MSVSLGGAFCAYVNLCMHIDIVSDRYSRYSKCQQSAEYLIFVVVDFHDKLVCLLLFYFI